MFGRKDGGARDSKNRAKMICPVRVPYVHFYNTATTQYVTLPKDKPAGLTFTPPASARRSAHVLLFLDFSNAAAPDPHFFGLLTSHQVGMYLEV